MKKHKLDLSFYQLSIWIPALIISALLVSCKSDTTTGPPVNPPQTNDSLIFEKDLLMVRATNPPVSSERIIYIHQSLFSKFKLTFKGETNITDSNFSEVSFALNDDTTFLNAKYEWGINSPSEINKTWTIQDSASSPINVFGIGMNIYYLNDSTKYVKLENIKFYRVD